MSGRSALSFLSILAVAVSFAGMAQARPLYFDNFTGLYGLIEGDDLYACGVCHRRWEGTGGRNPYGSAIEQQLYLGKPILDAIMAVENEDTDLDGTLNIDELLTFATLPGYSCDNFGLVIDPPANFQSLIEPGVPTCLDPKDLDVSPTIAAFVTEVGELEIIPLDLINNGSDDPISVTNVEFFGGADPALGLSVPPLPIALPVGATSTVDITFAPLVSTTLMATVRVTSDDPDEPTIDIPLTAFSFVRPLAPAEERASCLKEVDRRTQRFSRTHLREWGRCFLDELRGVACDTGRRDLKIGAAEEKLRDAIGGDKDKKCADDGLTPLLLGHESTCAAPCDAIPLTSMSGLAECIICSQETATNAVLQATIGSQPPDVPGTVLASSPNACTRRVQRAAEAGVKKVQKILGACALDNITSGAPVDCASAFAGDITKETDKIDKRFDKCSDTTGMQGCRFDETPDPLCLGNAALAVSSDMVDAIYGEQ